MNSVYVIRVGGEFHCVEDESTGLSHDEAELLPHVGNLTETCDSCGAGGQDSTYVLIRDAVPEFPAYECSACKHQYTVLTAHPKDAIFY